MEKTHSLARRGTPFTWIEHMSFPQKDGGSYRASGACVCFCYYPNQGAFESEDDALIIMPEQA